MGRKGATPKSKVTQHSSSTAKKSTSSSNSTAKGVVVVAATTTTLKNASSALNNNHISSNRKSTQDANAVGKGANKSVTPTKVIPGAAAAVVEEEEEEQKTEVHPHISNSDSEAAAQNEQKYLHKKFKRIASTAVDADGRLVGAVQLDTDASPNTVGEPSKVLLLRPNSRLSAPAEKGANAEKEEEEVGDRHRDLRNGFHPHSSVTSCDSGESVASGLVGVLAGHLGASSRDEPRVVAESDSVPRHIQSDRGPRVPVEGTSDCGGVVSEGDNGDSLSAGGGASQNNNNIGRNVCHYCNLNCTKPSVLEKHIRSHTNERPYPCVPCGFAFKTKSNLYKHCRSRAHQLRAQGAEVPPGQGGDDDISAGSDQELSSSASGSDEISRTASPVDENMMGSAQPTDKPYKPKFHKAVLYNEQQQHQHPSDEELRNTPATVSSMSTHMDTAAYVPAAAMVAATSHWNSSRGPEVVHPSLVNLQQHGGAPSPTVPSAMITANEMIKHGGNSSIPPRLSHLASQPYNLEQHISKLISRNEAIIEDVEPALQKKYHKITGKSRGNSLDFTAGGSSKAQVAALQQLQQFQAKVIREESLNNQHHMLVNHHHQQQQQYNHLARRASTPAGISLPSHFGGGMISSVPIINSVPIMHPSANHPSPPVKAAAAATKTKSPVHTTNQPLNLSKPAPVVVVVPATPVKNVINQLAMGETAASSTTTAPGQQQQQQHQAVHNVSSLTTLITNKLLKNTNIPNMKDFIENLRKQLSSEGSPSGCASDINVSSHPQNPERSIIKGLLLDWKSVSNNGLDMGAREGTSESGGHAEDAYYSCPVCKITFRNADTLQSHMKGYCQGNGVDKFSPTTLVNLARYKLRITPHSQKNPSPLAKLAQSMLGRNKSKPGNIALGGTSATLGPIPSEQQQQYKVPRIESVHYNPPVECVIAPLPSPGPLLGKTRLVDTYPSTSSAGRRYSESVANTASSFTQNRQMHVKTIPEPLVLPAGTSSRGRGVEKVLALPQSHSNLEMYGGELHVQPKRSLSKQGGDDYKLDFCGGSIVSESPLSDSEQHQISIRTPGLFSGGKMEKGASSRSSPPITPLTPSLLVTANQYTPSFMVAGSHFQFPPINAITAFNPLTLPTLPSPLSMAHHSAGVKVYGGRLIPDVPGMPGPETMHLRINPSLMHSALVTPPVSSNPINRSPSPMKGQGRGTKRSSSASPVNVQNNTLMAPPLTNGLLKTVKLEGSEEKNLRSPKERKTSRPLIWSPANLHSDNKKSFYFNRAEKEESRTDEKMSMDLAKSSSRQQLHVDVDMALPEASSTKAITPKFLRPSSLSLEPGTFTPKRHHGITPTANTLPLISPETPRPSKSCVQLYINGQAYTYLGLKCSTKPFYCTVNKTQPIYLPHHIRTISMYSQWQVCAESSPHPLGLKPGAVIGLYDSRQNQTNYSSATISSGSSLRHSQGPIMTPFETQRNHSIHHYVTRVATPPPPALPVPSVAVPETSAAVDHAMDAVDVRVSTIGDACEEDPKKDPSGVPVSVFGGYESNEDYEYIKGRGYGRFVCETCGIRCRKPSMLKKHIRTHTNIRPFTCQYCCFSFKTKGNLTKHMKSKSHAKKCEELGVSPLPTAEDMMEDSGPRNFNDPRLMAVIPGDSDSEDDSDGDDQSDGSDTEDIKARLPQEQEAARGLLSLSMTPPIIMTQAVDTYYSAPLTIDRLGEDLSLVKGLARSEFAVQKITFEFPRPEQYYSNPNIAKPPSAALPSAADSDLPMDLTKPRAVPERRPPGVAYTQQITEPASLISSLASITDKIPVLGGSGVGAGLDGNEQLQQYLTERAMHETKMKLQQHQMHQGDFRPTKCETVEESNASMLHQYLSEKAQPKDEVAVHEMPVRPSPNVAVETKQEPMASGMDTLADIAANSTKLGLLSAAGPESDASSRNTTAKFVASEYLKMATQRNTPGTLLKSDREDGESSSDQEVVSSGSSQRKRTDSVSEVLPRTVVVVKDPKKNKAEFVKVEGPQPRRVQQFDQEGRSLCEVCRQAFQKPSQLKLHMFTHFLERKFRCEPCGVSFRTQGHLHKHERSLSHHNKVSMTSTFGVATKVNPRPFNCADCRVAFRIHGHLAKHLRSKMHVLRLECLCKIPFGTYAEIERAGINLTNIDTKDCDTFLSSLTALARQLPELSLNVSESKASGEDTDGEGTEQGLSNGHGDSLSGNENGDRSKLDENKNGLTLKRKFGTLLSVNDTEEDLAEQQDGVGGGGGGGGSQADAGSGNSNDGAKEFEATGLSSSAAALEKRIKVS